MSKCIKCSKEISTNNDSYYGIIEEYHYDNRRTTSDSDTGAYLYEPVGLIKVDICNECLKEINNKWIINSILNLGIGIVLFSVMLRFNDLPELLLYVLFIASLIFIVRGLITFFKDLTITNRIKHLFNGKVRKEYVVAPTNDKDLDIEELPYSLEYRERYKYKFINEKKLQEPLKESKFQNSYDDALNELKKWYQNRNNEQNNSKETKEIVINSEAPKEDVVKESIEDNKIEEKHLEEKDKVEKNPLKNIFKNKKIIIGIICFILIIGLVGGIISTILEKNNFKTIDIDKYKTEVVYGSNGYGTLEIELDYERLIGENLNKIEFVNELPETHKDENKQKRLKEIVNYIQTHGGTYGTAFEIINLYICENNGHLSNGDTVYYQLNDDLELLNMIFKCHFKASKNGSITISNLSESKDIDIFNWYDDSYVEFKGPEGEIKARLNLSNLLGKTIYHNDNVEIRIKEYEMSNEKYYQFAVFLDNQEVDVFPLYFDRDNKLSNGDVITLKISDNDINKLHKYGINTICHSVAVLVKPGEDILITGKSITKEMVEYYAIHDALDRIDYDNVTISDFNLRSAIFFKVPKEYENGEDVMVVLDYDYTYSYGNKTGRRNVFGTLYNPYISDNKLYGSRYEVSDGDTYYKAVEEEYALVNENVEIDNYGDFLAALASSKTQKLIDAGYEDKEMVKMILKCFINENTYVIYEK